MRRLHLLIMGILLSALLIVPAFAGQTDVSADKPIQVKKHKVGIPPQTEQIKAGAQLNERRKRSDVRDKAAAKRKQMNNAGGGQQSQ